MKICLFSYDGLGTDGRGFIRALKEMASLAKVYEVKAIGLRVAAYLPPREIYQGVEIRRLLPPLSFDRKLQRELTKRDVISSIKRVYTLIIGNTLSSGLALFRAAWKEDADVYHCVGIYSLVPGFFLKILKRKRVIYDAVEVPHRQIRRISSLGLFAKPLSNIVGYLESFMASKVDYILTLPSANDEYLKRFQKVNNKVVVLKNVPPLDWKGVRKPELVRKFSGKKVLVYHGGFTRARGMLKMVKAFDIVRKNFPEVKLLLGGSFKGLSAHDNAEEEVMNYIQSHALQEDIVITGHIPWQEMPKYLGIADIALKIYQSAPAFIESQGSSSLFECLAASLPVIASALPGIGSIVRKYNCGITVDPTNEQEIANAILKLLSNPELARELGQNGRKAFEQEFNWKLEEEKLLKVYQSFENKEEKK